MSKATGLFMGELTLVMRRTGWQLRLVALLIGEISTSVKKASGI